MVEPTDINSYMDDRTVVTNRLLIDLLLCLKHHTIGALPGDMSVGELLQGLNNWAGREEKISDGLEDLITGLFGEEKRNELLEHRLKELRESTSSTQVEWGYR